MTATANGSGLGDGIATLGMKHNYFFTSEEVYSHAETMEELARGLVDKEEDKSSPSSPR